MDAILTVGHSNHTLEHLVALLAGVSVEVVADVRSAPRSRFAHFKRAPLERAMTQAGVRYVYLGDDLGGRPVDPAFYDESAHVRYDLLASSDRFRAGIEQLLRIAGRSRVAILCSEEDPDGCHRRLLIGRVLTGRGVDLAHIRGDGRLQAERTVDAPAGLFDLGSGTAWRSARPVSRR